MSDATMSNRPEMRWVEVLDTQGRPRLEARWIVPADEIVTAHAA